MDKWRFIRRMISDKWKIWTENNASPGAGTWIMLGLLLLIPFLSMAYMDLKSIIHYEVNFTDAILHDDILNYYDFCYEKANAYMQMGIEGTAYATYDFPMYLVLGIWGIPLYAYEQLAGVEITETMLGLVYGKSVYIAALVLASWLIYKICKEAGIEAKEAKWASFLFLSSILIFTSICMIGQSDILGIVAILAGILAFMRRQRRQFLLWFILAISFKQYGLFVFMPLLLLIEKRIWSILVDSEFPCR